MSDSLKKAQAMVREWQKIFDEVKPSERPITSPWSLPDKVRHLREDLINEEADEFGLAAADNDLVAVADALGDLLYVVLGAANTYGIDMSAIFDEIHRTNMDKTRGIRLPSGKWQKPADWKPPRIKELLIAQGWRDAHDE